MGTASIGIELNEKNLAGNPIVARMFMGHETSGRYRLYRLDGTSYSTIYEGVIYTQNESAPVDLSSLFEELISTAGVTSFKLSLLLDAHSEVETNAVEFQVYGGGISKLLQRKLAGTTIFSEKICNYNSNFFLTTRTNNRTICVSELELLPLFFYAKGVVINVKFDGIIVASFDYQNLKTETLESIDFREIRKQVAIKYLKFVSVFDIFYGNSYSCSVVITEAECPTKYFLKFKNSWGAWEKIAVSGDIDLLPEFDDPISYTQWDPEVQDFVSKFKRKINKTVFAVDLGYKSTDYKQWIMDMIYSDNVLFVAGEYEFQANVIANTNLFATTKIEPSTISLSVELVDKDMYFSPLEISKDYTLLTNNSSDFITSGNDCILI